MIDDSFSQGAHFSQNLVGSHFLRTPIFFHPLFSIHSLPSFCAKFGVQAMGRGRDPAANAGLYIFLVRKSQIVSLRQLVFPGIFN